MTKIEMTNEEAIEYNKNLREYMRITDKESECKFLKENYEALEMAIKALKQQSCEAIEEIPKDYKYDTETEDFLVYRHKYTGHEIHIEKPVPRYKLEQQPCEDCISRQSAIDAFERFIHELGIKDEPYNYGEMALSVQNVPSVTPQQNTGHWEDCSNGWMCSNCGRDVSYESDFCPNCGADMRGEDK